MFHLPQAVLTRLPVPKVRASIPRAFVSLGVSKGLEAADILKAGGLGASDISNLDQQVLGFSVLRMLRHLETRLPDQSVGLQIAAHIDSHT